MTTKTPFIIVAPPYNPTSAGCVVLHRLCDALNRMGHPSYLLINIGDQFIVNNDSAYFDSNLIRTNFTGDLTENCTQLIKDGIVIYPEVVIGNPLNAKKVVRYLLYFDGLHMGQKMNHSDNDFIISYSTIFSNIHREVLYYPILNDLFNAEHTQMSEQRSIDLTYTDNRKEKENVHIIENTIHINKSWPENKQQLANILRKTRYFYSWTDLSSTNVDAIFCGAIPVLIDPDPAKLELMKTSETGSLPCYIAKVIDGNLFTWSDVKFHEKRISYIKRIKDYEANWNNNVSNVFNKVLKHFELS